jgi:hypothetical protein
MIAVATNIFDIILRICFTLKQGTSLPQLTECAILTGNDTGLFSIGAKV